MTWKSKELPRLYTPINHSTIFEQKRLLIIIQLTEGTVEKAEDFAYINLDLSETEQANFASGSGESWERQKVFKDVPVIGYNTHIGSFDATVKYRVN